MALEGISYRSSGHDLSAAGEAARKAGLSKSKVVSECKSKGLDKEQTDIVLGGYADSARGDADDKKPKKDAEAEGGQEPNVDYKGALKGAQEAHTNFQTAKDQYRKGDITPELFNAAKQTYEASAKDFDKTFAEAQIRGDADLPRMNPLKISRLADSISDVARRFDAHVRMDSDERWGLPKWTQNFHAEANRIGVDVSKVLASELQAHHSSGLSVREALGKYENNNK